MHVLLRLFLAKVRDLVLSGINKSLIHDKNWDQDYIAFCVSWSQRTDWIEMYAQSRSGWECPPDSVLGNSTEAIVCGHRLEDKCGR